MMNFFGLISAGLVMAASGAQAGSMGIVCFGPNNELIAVKQLSGDGESLVETANQDFPESQEITDSTFSIRYFEKGTDFVSPEDAPSKAINALFSENVPASAYSEFSSIIVAFDPVGLAIMGIDETSATVGGLVISQISGEFLALPTLGNNIAEADPEWFNCHSPIVIQ